MGTFSAFIHENCVLSIGKGICKGIFSKCLLEYEILHELPQIEIHLPIVYNIIERLGLCHIWIIILAPDMCQCKSFQTKIVFIFPIEIVTENCKNPLHIQFAL